MVPTCPLGQAARTRQEMTMKPSQWCTRTTYRQQSWAISCSTSGRFQGYNRVGRISWCVCWKLIFMVADGADIVVQQTEFHTTNSCHTDCTCLIHQKWVHFWNACWTVVSLISKSSSICSLSACSMPRN